MMRNAFRRIAFQSRPQGTREDQPTALEGHHTTSSRARNPTGCDTFFNHSKTQRSTKHHPNDKGTSMFRLLNTMAVGLLWLVSISCVHAAAPRPNILFIMVDDLGKEWISSYGAEGIRTPNIDKLAATGMKFNNAWCMPQCTPTRVTLLTGQYPFRHGWTNHWDVPRWGGGGPLRRKEEHDLCQRTAGSGLCHLRRGQVADR